MAKFVMTKSDGKFGAPEGTYLCRYLGSVEKTHPEYGPGLEWQFEVVEGAEKGKIVSRTTAPSPTTKNSCGAVLKQLAGGVIELGREVDEAQFVGKFYTVMVGPNSTGNGTRVETLMPHAGAAPAGLPPPPAPKAAYQESTPSGGNGAGRPPASRPPAGGPPPRKAAGKLFWAHWPGEANPEPAMAPSESINARIQRDHIDPAELQLCPEGGSDWRPASELGFEDPVPF